MGRHLLPLLEEYQVGRHSILVHSYFPMATWEGLCHRGVNVCGGKGGSKSQAYGRPAGLEGDDDGCVTWRRRCYKGYASSYAATEPSIGREGCVTWGLILLHGACLGVLEGYRGPAHGNMCPKRAATRQNVRIWLEALRTGSPYSAGINQGL